MLFPDHDLARLPFLSSNCERTRAYSASISLFFGAYSWLYRSCRLSRHEELLLARWHFGNNYPPYLPSKAARATILTKRFPLYHLSYGPVERSRRDSNPRHVVPPAFAMSSLRSTTRIEKRGRCSAVELRAFARRESNPLPSAPCSSLCIRRSMRPVGFEPTWDGPPGSRPGASSISATAAMLSLSARVTIGDKIGETLPLLFHLSYARFRGRRGSNPQPTN
ncbi:MAG: hypothetical protein JWL69_3637 [Phycisphaerales bacterium]|nr:hypothetical protein [Phycisphaerales bacterium]